MSGAFAERIESDTPFRSNASLRSTPTLSRQTSFSFDFPSNQLSPCELSSAEQSPIRGRTLIRTPAYERRRASTTDGRMVGARSVAFDSASIRPRIMSRDLTTEPDDMFNSIREPLPVGIERFPGSLSEELYKAATWGTDVDVSRFGDHRDTFAILGLRHLQDRRLALPSVFFNNLLPYIDFESYLAVRLSCRCWSAAITRARPLSWPSVFRLPAEVLENIFTRLDPVDFNSARHTCRAWMIASLEERLLTVMLNRGGWWGAALADTQVLLERGEHSPVHSVNGEWLLSKRLATECSLRPDWTGNGLLESSSSRPTTSTTGVIVASEMNFTELSNGYSHFGNNESSTALHFTVSVCNRFLLVAEGCVIFIYSLRDDSSTSHEHGGHLSPITIVICPHRVLAVSMDTSSGRFALAALLVGRIGMVCDLREGTSSPQRHFRPRTFQSNTRDFRPTIYSPSSSGERIMTEDTPANVHGATHDEYTDHRGFYPSDRALARAVAEGMLPEIHGARDAPASWTIDDPLTAMSAASGASLSGPITGFLPIEGGPRSIYRNLCSAEDPPRSVAICPQRRCVAFGCSAGIELHWIDALTGQDLNRWFPLTSPSDFLYFLPPRPGVDSAKKLRLISSACHPKEQEGLQGRFFPGNAEARHYGMSWDEGMTDTTAWNNCWRGSGWCDHYRAVPVSDGWNVLFTDPEEGTLSVGSDAPPGMGATKLVRRFVFAGPTDETGAAVVPRVYASGGELSWGLRVLAGYSEAVWLFVIPPEQFLSMERKTATENAGRHEANGVRANSPVRIEGKEIGRVPGLVDVAVDSTAGDLTLWAFSVNGMAYIWQIEGRTKPIVNRFILQDGAISLAEDAEGDTIMHNTSTRAVQFDGTNSVRPSTHTLYAPRDRIIDNDGDITMPDAEFDDEGYAFGDDEHNQAGGILAIHAPPIWGRWSEDDDDWVPGYLASHGEGIEDEGFGVDLWELTRLEIEVLRL